MLPMRLMTPLQASMASLSMVLPEATCPTMAKLRISGGWSIFIPKCVFRVRAYYPGAAAKRQIFLRESGRDRRPELYARRCRELVEKTLFETESYLCSAGLAIAF